MTVCDVYDALISPRVYRAAWTHEDAVALLHKDSRHRVRRALRRRAGARARARERDTRRAVAYRQCFQCVRQPLPRRQHALEQIAVLADAVANDRPS